MSATAATITVGLALWLIVANAIKLLGVRG
jgi:hypothetical protein